MRGLTYICLMVERSFLALLKKVTLNIEKLKSLFCSYAEFSFSITNRANERRIILEPIELCIEFVATRAF